MKYKLLLFLILACGICGAQRLSSKSAKIDLLTYPRLNTDKTQTININIDNSFSEINKDSLRGYSGTMDVLTGNNGLRLGKFQGKSKNEMMIVNGTADYNFDISFGQPKVLEKRVNSMTRAGSTAYYYGIDYEYPAIIKITDSKNDLVDIWKLNPYVYVDYGASKVTKRIYDGPVTTILTYSNIFNSESDLEDAYDSYGESVVEREALVLQLKQAIEDIDDRLYFFETKDDFDVYTAKGRKHDYSELDDAQDLAVKAIGSQNFDDLKQSISIWEKYLEQADEDDKSKINLDIKEGLLSNLALGNMYLNNFNDALSYAAAYKKQIEANSNKVKMIGNTIVQTTGLQNETIDYVKANYLLKTVYGRAEAFKNNNSKSIDFDHLKDGIDLKKEIGRQSKNYQYDLFENTNSYNKFSGELLNYVRKKVKSTVLT